MPMRAAALAGLVLVPSALGAQVDEAPLRNSVWGVSVGFNASPVLGVAGTGFVARDLRALGVPLRGTVALDLIFSPDEDSPYYRDPVSGGGSVCRNASNGQFADDAYCVRELDIAGRGELMAVVSRHWGIGAGARVGASAPNPYGLVRYEAPFAAGNPSWFGQVSGGDHFFQLDAGVAIRFR